jgi:hypothetical protein
MGKKEFIGHLRSISPNSLINKNEKDKFQSFFLVLGMIFNDLKGLIFFQKLVEDNYRKPDKEEVSVHLGEYGALLTQTNKFLISSVAEFLQFLEKNNDVLSDIRFLILLKKLDQDTRTNWNDLVNPKRDTTSIISKIARIRSNISFHYDHSLEELRKGFIRSFFSEGKELIQHKRAYYSLGETMESTRFYYSDAAVEEYIKSHITEEEMGNINKAINNMNSTLQALLKVYIQSIDKNK